MYCLIISSGAPPTVETKYELVQSVGRRDFNDGNSDRKACEEAPLICLTARLIPYCGSTSIKRCTWSGMTSISITSALISADFCAMSSFKRSAILPTRTLRRYLGHQTTWYLHEYTTLLFDLYSMYILYHTFKSNAIGLTKNMQNLNERGAAYIPIAEARGITPHSYKYPI